MTGKGKARILATHPNYSLMFFPPFLILKVRILYNLGFLMSSPRPSDVASWTVSAVLPLVKGGAKGLFQFAFWKVKWDVKHILSISILVQDSIASLLIN